MLRAAMSSGLLAELVVIVAAVAPEEEVPPIAIHADIAELSGRLASRREGRTIADRAAARDRMPRPAFPAAARAAAWESAVMADRGRGSRAVWPTSHSCGGTAGLCQLIK